MIEVLTLIEGLHRIFNFIDKNKLLVLIKDKLNKAFYGEDNFLLYVRNPVKMLILLIELIDKKL